MVFGGLWRELASGGESCCGFSRMCEEASAEVLQNMRTSPPRLRRCPPKRGASCCGFSRMCEQAPRACGAAPRSGAVSWLLGRLCFAPGRFEICDEVHEGARCEPRRSNPRQEAHQTWGACPRILLNLQQEAHLWGAVPKRSEARGACHTLCSTHNKPPVGHQPPNRRQVCPPPEA